MIGVIRLVVARLIVGISWLWAMIRGLASRPTRKKRVRAGQSDVRRRYVFGAISRETFDAAMRKTRRRSARRRAG
jgi:hypothetical protein